MHGRQGKRHDHGPRVQPACTVNAGKMSLHLTYVTLIATKCSCEASLPSCMQRRAPPNDAGHTMDERTGTLQEGAHARSGAAVGSPMIEVPAGEFWMGSRGSDANPRRRVYVDRYSIDRVEVTAAEYASCVARGACGKAKTGGACSSDVSGKEMHPINCVTWAQAKSYCEFVGKRLPSEVEWEKAARGGEEVRFPWGDSWPPPVRSGNLADESARRAHPFWVIIDGYDDGFAETAPVGSFSGPVALFGARDMAGNVQEWTDDLYLERAPSRTPQKRAKEATVLRAVRGSSYGHHRPDDLAVTRRSAYRADVASEHIGFRCARSSP